MITLIQYECTPLVHVICTPGSCPTPPGPSKKLIAFNPGLHECIPGKNIITLIQYECTPLALVHAICTQIKNLTPTR